MIYKGKVKQDIFFNKLIKANCKFKRFGNFYACNCKKNLYIGIKSGYKEVEVFEISKEESKFFKALIKTFKEPILNIQDLKLQTLSH